MGEAVTAARRWVGWEEKVVSGDKGRRVVHYYLRCGVSGGGGERELAVLGTERSPRHMAYEVPRRFLRSLELAGARAPSPSRSPAAAAEGAPLKWRSRREVMDWLTSLVSDSTYGSSTMTDNRFHEYSFDDDDGNDAEFADVPASKDLSSTVVGNNSKDFAWLGPVSHSKKRQKHYRSFCRKGITISVHDFVYIMSEAKKRVVAYVEDMYEDIRANNMVVIRWFHKVDEVGVPLPPSVDDREIFFSHCLQDLRVECIDGLTAVLDAQHFEKFHNSSKHSNWQPYLCCRQIDDDDDDVKPFDITQLQGYWDQEVLTAMLNASSSSSLKVRLKVPNKNDQTWGKRPPSRGSGSSSDGGQKRKMPSSDGGQKRKMPSSDGRQKRKMRSSDEGDKRKTPSSDGGQKRTLPSPDGGQKRKHDAISDQTGRKRPHSRGSGSDLLKSVLKHNIQQQLYRGCHVEVLCQDSGIRGCWFRCLILKRHKHLIKVQYQDVQNADETGSQEEWLWLTRIADPDQLGIRLSGRPMVRPHHSQWSRTPCSVDVGTIVDAWWCDGWWEGIVVQQENDGRVQVYFPGEKRIVALGQGDLRHSLEWVGNKWNPLKKRNDIAYQLPPGTKHGNKVKSCEIISQEAELCTRPETQKASLQSDEKGVDNSTKSAAQKASLQSSEKGDDASAKSAARKAVRQSSGNDDDKSAKPAAQKASLQSSEGDDKSAKPATQKASDKDDSACAKLVAQKASLQSSEKVDDKSVGKKFTPDHKRCAVDLANALRSDNLKWTARRRRRCGGSSGSSSQDIEESSPSGNHELVNSVTDKEVCKIIGDSLFGAPPMSNLLMSR